MIMARYPYDKKRPDVKCAIESGWEFCGFAGSGHLQFTHPGTKVRLIIPCSASDPRSSANSVAWIRRNTPREE